MVWLSLRSKGFCLCLRELTGTRRRFLRRREKAGIRLRVDRAERGRKTSVLNCISGLYPGEGAIRFRGTSISRMSAHQVARLGIARTFQHGELFPHMTVAENLLTGRHARIRTNPLKEMFFTRTVRREEVTHREAVVEKIIDFVELERYRNAPVANLPFGIQKIVGFARALAMEPAILLLDEPSAGTPTATSAKTSRVSFAYQARARDCDDLDRARHANGRRSFRPASCA